MKLFRIRFSYLYICFSFFLAAALWYTVKIDCLDRAGELKAAGRALLDFWDVPILLLGTAFFSLLLPKLVDRLSGFFCSRRTAADRTWVLPAFLLMVLWQLPFLLSFYPAPGMNDTVFMMAPRSACPAWQDSRPTHRTGAVDYTGWDAAPSDTFYVSGPTARWGAALPGLLRSDSADSGR